MSESCGICGYHRNRHIGRVNGCPGGYGTSFNPDGKRDFRVWPDKMVGTEALGNGNEHFGIHDRTPFCKQRDCIEVPR